MHLKIPRSIRRGLEISNSKPGCRVSALHFFVTYISPMSFGIELNHISAFFKLIYSGLTLTKLVENYWRTRVWKCHKTRGHQKTTIFTSVVYGLSYSKLWRRITQWYKIKSIEGIRDQTSERRSTQRRLNWAPRQLGAVTTERVTTERRYNWAPTSTQRRFFFFCRPNQFNAAPHQLSADSNHRCFDSALIRLSACKKNEKNVLLWWCLEPFTGVSLLISVYLYFSSLNDVLAFNLLL